MGNMPYCRFRNTLMDMRECYHAMYEGEELEGEEAEAWKDIIDLCAAIGAVFGKGAVE